MKIVKYLFYSLVIFSLLVGLSLLVASLQPANYSLSKTVTIEAPADLVYDQLSDLHNWAYWQGWYARDTSIQLMFEGDGSGAGSSIQWESQQIGTGKLTLQEAQKPSSISYRHLAFEPEFEMLGKLELIAQNQQTQLRWTLSGKHKLAGKFFSLLMDLDQSLGMEMSLSLARLKLACERAAEQRRLSPNLSA